MPIFKFSFGEVYRRTYSWKFSLRRRASGVVKHDFRTYIRRYTSPNKNVEYGYPHSNALELKHVIQRKFDVGSKLLPFLDGYRYCLFSIYFLVIMVLICYNREL